MNILTEKEKIDILLFSSRIFSNFSDEQEFTQSNDFGIQIIIDEENEIIKLYIPKNKIKNIKFQKKI